MNGTCKFGVQVSDGEFAALPRLRASFGAQRQEKPDPGRRTIRLAASTATCARSHDCQENREEYASRDKRNNC
jgi:hypothetical protein